MVSTGTRPASTRPSRVAATVANSWMTAYMEGFGLVGNDTDRDPADLDPQGQQTRLVNDIFPDNLFTPGTRINMFFKTKFIAGTSWYTTPDTALGRYFEVEVLPSSMAADSTFNCVLFVDHATDRGSAIWIEPALAYGADRHVGQLRGHGVGSVRRARLRPASRRPSGVR